MNKTEEYLDSLLNNVSPERKAEADRKRQRTSEDFAKEFENDLDDDNIDDVILEFEKEIGSQSSADRTDDGFFGNLEGIVNNAKEASAAKQTNQNQTIDDRFEIDTLEDEEWIAHPDTDVQSDSDDVISSKEEQELADLLSDLPTVENDIASVSEDVGPTYQEDDESDEPKAGEKPEKERKKEEKKGFFGKLSRILFGEDDDDLEEDSSPKKEKKKKEKKEKKPKEKKEKEKKPKAPKPKKEKKPKKPKEIDLTPPLPKAPVVLIFIMSLSVMLFVLISSNLLGYSVSMTDAKRAYSAQDYVGAYQKIAGLNVKSKDEEFGEKVLLLAKVQAKLNNGDSLYGTGNYIMALDSYICALGRYNANYKEAEACSIQNEYDSLQQQIIQRLEENFQVNTEEAAEIYRLNSLNNRTEYSIRIYNIVKDLGLAE